MATTDNANPGQSPQRDIFCRWTGLAELHIAIGIGEALGCVEVDIKGLPGDHSLSIAPAAALEIAFRLLGSIARLQNIGDRT